MEEKLFKKLDSIAKDLACCMHAGELSKDDRNKVIEMVLRYLKASSDHYLTLLEDMEKNRITYSDELADIMRERLKIK